MKCGLEPVFRNQFKSVTYLSHDVNAVSNNGLYKSIKNEINKHSTNVRFCLHELNMLACKGTQSIAWLFMALSSVNTQHFSGIDQF